MIKCRTTCISQWLDFFIYNWFFFRFSDLKKGLTYLSQITKEGEKSNADLHRANLCSLINCVDTLSALHDEVQLQKNIRGWPLTKSISEKVFFVITSFSIKFRITSFNENYNYK